MASNRLHPCLVRLAVVSAISTVTVGLLPGIGQAVPLQQAVPIQQAVPVQPAAVPRTASEAAQQVARLRDQLEILGEEVNGARVREGKQRDISKRADKAAIEADKRYRSLSDQVAKIVRSTYMSAPFGQFTTLMTSDSPQDFLDQLSTLERMGKERGRLISSVLQNKQQLDVARETAQKALGAAHAEYTARVTKQRKLQAQIGQFTTIYQRLSAQERAQLNGGTAATRSSRAPVPTPTNLPPASGKAQVAVSAALAQQGKPYVWGAAGPNAYDCSGLTMYAWGQAGVSLPHQSADQYGYGTHVPASLAYLKPGDLLFFYSPIHHVAMYIGNGMMVHAPTFGDVVKVAGVDWANLVGATRL